MRRRSSPETPRRSNSASVSFISGDRRIPSTAAILAMESRPRVRLSRICPVRDWTRNSPPDFRSAARAASVASACVLWTLLARAASPRFTCQPPSVGTTCIRTGALGADDLGVVERDITRILARARLDGISLCRAMVERLSGHLKRTRRMSSLVGRALGIPGRSTNLRAIACHGPTPCRWRFTSRYRSVSDQSRAPEKNTRLICVRWRGCLHGRRQARRTHDFAAVSPTPTRWSIEHSTHCYY